MTNQSLRERFKLEDTRAKIASVSQIIAATVSQGLIKLDDPENALQALLEICAFLGLRFHLIADVD